MEVKRPDDFHRLLGQMQAPLKRLKDDANALRTDLSELRRLGEYLGLGYTRLGDICRLTEKRSEVTADVLDAIEKRIEPLEVLRDLSATTEDRLASLKQLVDEVTRCGVSFEAQKEAIDQGRVEATRVGLLMEELQARVKTVTDKAEWLRRAEETVGRLEHRAVETTARLERRVNDFDTQKQTIEHAVAEAIRVTAVLSALEGRVAALIGSDRMLGQAETAIDKLERRTAEVRVRLEQVVRAKSDIEHELERVGKQLQTLTESARNSVSVLRSTDPSRASAWKIGLPLRRPAALLGALVAVALLGIVMLRTRDQPNQIAATAAAAHQEPPVAAPGSLLPGTASGFAMFEMPAGRAPATTGTIAAREVSSANRRDPPRAARTAQAAGASQSGSSKETAQYVGALTVDSEPTGSVVFVDRQRVGETPLQLTHLRAGSHVVRIERDGYDRWTTAVLVAADKQTRVSATLQPARDR